MRDEYRKTALKYFMAAQEANDPEMVHRLSETAQECIRLASIETALHHALRRGPTGSEEYRHCNL